MSKGYWAGEAIAQTLARVGDAVEYSNAVDRQIEQRKRAEKAEADLHEMCLSVAAHMAEKNALRTALRKWDPQHPLLTNAHLRERIHAAGEKVFLLSDSTWDDVARAGRDFKY